MPRPRRTLLTTVAIRGLGLFTGERARLEIRPAEPGHGIRFERLSEAFEATAAHLSSAVPHDTFRAIGPRSTTLSASPDSGAPVHTVEHLLAALAGLGITDAHCVVEGPEIPIADGSAKPFIDILLAAGLTDLGEAIEPIRVEQPIEVTGDNGRSSVRVEPADRVLYRYEADFGDRPIAAAAAEWDGDPDQFVQGVAPARTFSFHDEAQSMKDAGLFRAFSPADLPVIAADGSLIDNEWLFPDEPARHKLLDLIGDLALVGRPLLARVVAVRSGHALHHRAAEAIRAACL